MNGGIHIKELYNLALDLESPLFRLLHLRRAYGIQYWSLDVLYTYKSCESAGHKRRADVCVACGTVQQTEYDKDSCHYQLNNRNYIQFSAAECHV